MAVIWRESKHGHGKKDHENSELCIHTFFGLTTSISKTRIQALIIKILSA